MPTYSFRSKETGEITEKILKMSEKDQYIKDNPDLEAVILSAPVMTYTSSGIMPDRGFSEVMDKIKQRTGIRPTGQYVR